MKKTLSIILALILCLCMFAGCKSNTTDATSSATSQNDANVVYPLPETLDINNLDNCTVPVSFEKGGAYVGDGGKTVMNVTVYSNEVYDMADIASLSENDVIVRQNEQIKITQLERINTGIVRINGGEQNGGFDLFSNDDTVYFEIGVNDMKNYYELGNITLPVSDEFEYIDESDIGGNVKQYYAKDILADSGIEYNFYPNNTSIVIQDGAITKMIKVYMP